MKRILLSITTLSLLAVLMTGCSEDAAPKKQAKKAPPAPVTAQSAMLYMFQVARTWMPDCEILKLENGDIPEAKAEAGKYGLWRATFVSQSKRVKRDYYYAADNSEGGIIKGVRAGADSAYARRAQIHPFAIQEIKIDSPAALKAAMDQVEKDKDMKKALAGNKDLPVQFLLEWTGNNPKPQWRVIYGASVSASKFSIFIDAFTGKFVKKQG
ncbi:MAG: hypothetical protein HY858_11330 [Candidatus Solibacter usitatus]|nr:hypothetical protein [Candidatus Solibacter usitatus]